MSTSESSSGGCKKCLAETAAQPSAVQCGPQSRRPLGGCRWSTLRVQWLRTSTRSGRKLRTNPSGLRCGCGMPLRFLERRAHRCVCGALLGWRPVHQMASFHRSASCQRGASTLQRPSAPSTECLQLLSSWQKFAAVVWPTCCWSTVPMWGQLEHGANVGAAANNWDAELVHAAGSRPFGFGPGTVGARCGCGPGAAMSSGFTVLMCAAQRCQTDVKHLRT